MIDHEAVRVSIGIQASPARADMAALLAEQCNADVVFDPTPDHPRRSPWRTYRAVLEATPGFECGFTNAGAPSHRMVVQDDGELCEGFTSTLTAAVAARPDRVLVFHVSGNPYEHKQAMERACARGVSWAELTTARWCSAVATCWPVRLIHPLLRYVDEQLWPESFVADDEIIGRFLRDHGETPLGSVPSLVQHPDLVPSLLGKKHRLGVDPGRVAVCFPMDDCALSVDWTLGPG